MLLNGISKTDSKNESVSNQTETSTSSNPTTCSSPSNNLIDKVSKQDKQRATGSPSKSILNVNNAATPKRSGSSSSTASSHHQLHQPHHLSPKQINEDDTQNTSNDDLDEIKVYNEEGAAEEEQRNSENLSDEKTEIIKENLEVFNFFKIKILKFKINSQLIKRINQHRHYLIHLV